MRRAAIACALAIVLSIVCSGQAAAATTEWRSGTANWTAEHALFLNLDAAHYRACGRHLRSDVRLIRETRWRSYDQVERGYFGHHIPPTGAIFSSFLGRFGISDSWRRSGEIIHWDMGYPRGTEASVAFISFRNSPPHWQVITNCAFTVVGVGTYQRDGHYYFTADYLGF